MTKSLENKLKIVVYELALHALVHNF